MEKPDTRVQWQYCSDHLLVSCSTNDCILYYFVEERGTYFNNHDVWDMLYGSLKDTEWCKFASNTSAKRTDREPLGQPRRPEKKSGGMTFRSFFVWLNIINRIAETLLLYHTNVCSSAAENSCHWYIWSNPLTQPYLFRIILYVCSCGEFEQERKEKENVLLLLYYYKYVLLFWKTVTIEVRNCTPHRQSKCHIIYKYDSMFTLSRTHLDTSAHGLTPAPQTNVFVIFTNTTLP